MAEIDRPELLTRGFSNVYVVRALGLPSFTVYSANQTYQAEKERSEATADDLTEVKEYVSEHYAAPNSKYYGIAQGKNVIVIHLESFQQFLIDYKLEVDGQSYEVTPSLIRYITQTQLFLFQTSLTKLRLVRLPMPKH